MGWSRSRPPLSYLWRHRRADERDERGSDLRVQMTYLAIDRRLRPWIVQEYVLGLTMPYSFQAATGFDFVRNLFRRQSKDSVSTGCVDKSRITDGENSKATTTSSGIHLVDASIEIFLLRAILIAREYADSNSCCACGARFSCNVLRAEVAKPMIEL